MGAGLICAWGKSTWFLLPGLPWSDFHPGTASFLLRARIQQCQHRCGGAASAQRSGARLINSPRLLFPRGSLYRVNQAQSNARHLCSFSHFNAVFACLFCLPHHFVTLI